MKFKAPEGKQVMTPKGVVRFRKGEYETTDEGEIKALKGAKDVSTVGGKQEPEAKK